MTSFKWFGIESTNFFKVNNSIPCHTSIRVSFNSFWLLGFFFLSCRSTSSHRCSMSFKCDENDGQWSRSIPFLFSRLATMAVLCFRSLSCCKIQSSLMPNFSTDFILKSLDMTRSSYCHRAIFTWWWEASPILDITTTMFDSEYGAFGFKLLLTRTTFPLDTRRLNLLSSDQSTLFQKPKGFSQ